MTELKRTSTVYRRDLLLPRLPLNIPEPRPL